MHPIESLASAIATMEGVFTPGTTPALRKNPGDLRMAGQLNASGAKGTIAVFPTAAMGTAALFRQLWLQVAEGQTVRQIIAQWAPPNENNTSLYLQNILRWTGLPPDVPVLDLLPPLSRMN